MKVDKDMTIYTAAELKPALLAEATGSREPLIDCSGVGEIDCAGLQLLLLARREAIAAGRSLRLVGDSPAVAELLTLAGYGALLGEPLPEAAGGAR
jgi:anti-sigma B factor antagonist